MRIDQFLVLCRIVKRRSLAKELADAGQIRIGEETAKPGRQVREGDELEIRQPGRVLRVRVREIPPRRPSREAALAYFEIIEETRTKSPADDRPPGPSVDFLSRK
ncbi:MAG: S4 domain-containing protein [bacterium]|nr:S4 domain-containing protein [bacterium]